MATEGTANPPSLHIEDNMKFHLDTHINYVAACEQLAEDLVEFHADPVELVITVKELPPESTLLWFKRVSVSE